MTATLAAPTPDLIDLLIVAVVVLGTAYVLLFEIGLPTLRHWWRNRPSRRPGYVEDIGR